MAGVKQFDSEVVIDRAMMHFWRIGYGATSIKDLEKATKLRRGSLYNAFGDKEALFIAALKRYDSVIGSKRIEALSNPDPHRAIESFLSTLVEQLSEPGRPRGCLHTNTSLEIPSAPTAIMRIVVERTSAIEDAIYAVLRSAKRREVLDRTVDERALARFYLGVAKGITVLHKLYGNSAMLRDVAKVALNKWPAADAFN